MNIHVCYAVKVEDALKQRSKLDTEKSLRETAGATKLAGKRLRAALGAASIANTASYMVKGRMKRQQPQITDPYAAEANGAE